MASASSDTCSDLSGCSRRAARGGLCWTHDRRRRAGVTEAEIRERRAAADRLQEAALAYADAPDGDDREYAHAADNLRKAAVAYRRSSVTDAVKQGMDAAKRRGKPIGRPATVPTAVAWEAFKRLKKVAKVAEELKASRFAVRRALGRRQR